MDKAFWKGFGKFLYVNKEGALIGGSVGLAMYLYIKAQGVSLMAVTASRGMLDTVLPASTPLELASIKVALTCILVGSLIGIIADSIFKPGK